MAPGGLVLAAEEFTVREEPYYLPLGDEIELFEAERYGWMLALDGVYQTSGLDEHLYGTGR